ncbi:hypothetical protein [Streptomyces klenkii]|uniref:hypothetical protein n=1 Tax=Streptomyces klenkii TaxID=1420899 RepID=UPI00342988EA
MSASTSTAYASGTIPTTGGNSTGLRAAGIERDACRYDHVQQPRAQRGRPPLLRVQCADFVRQCRR